MSLPPLHASDLAHVLTHTQASWQRLRGAHLFITGATGFYGKWLLEAIRAANDELDVHITATLLSRDPATAALAIPHLASRPEFTWLRGSTDDFAFPRQAADFVFDFATPSAAEVASEVGVGGTALQDATLAGVARVIDYARHSHTQRVLYASSGAVYGTTRSMAYAALKQRSEALYLASRLDCVITRGFSFIGPYLPLTDKFAVGSFLRDALAGGPIRIQGDGTPLRSYLYAADLAIWLLVLLTEGQAGAAYDMGSDEAVSLAKLAKHIAQRHPGCAVNIAQPAPTTPAESYLPALTDAHHVLGLKAFLPLDPAIQRTWEWATRQSALHGTAAGA